MRTRIGALVLLASLAAAAQVPQSVIGANTTQAASTLTASCSTGLSCTTSSTAIIPMAGQQTATVVVTASTSPVGLNAVVDCTKDSSATPVWLLSGTPATSGLVGLQLNNAITYVVNNPVAGSSYTLVPTPECKGALSYRWRISGLTSVTTFTVQPHSVAGALGDWSYVAGQLLQLGQQIAAKSLPVTFSQEQGPLPLSIYAAAGTSQPVPVTVTTTTETTLVAAIGTGLFTDFTLLACFNNTSTATQIDIRDSTGNAAISFTGIIAATVGAGFIAPFSPSAPWRSKTSNGNWTMKLGTAVGGAGVTCNAQAQQRVP